MEVEAAEHQQELFLREVEVDEGDGDRVEREVPRRVPRVLPLVGHGDHVAVEHVVPVHVSGAPLPSEKRVRLVLDEPSLDVEVVDCFDHSIPASAWRNTRRSSALREGGVTRS
jgi:hypothetical protein